MSFIKFECQTLKLSWERIGTIAEATLEFLFCFKLEPRGFSCHAYIGSLVLEIIKLIGLFITLCLLGKVFVILMVSKSERTYIQVI